MYQWRLTFELISPAVPFCLVLADPITTHINVSKGTRCDKDQPTTRITCKVDHLQFNPIHIHAYQARDLGFNVC
jgi:hypothetical protein